VNCGEYLDEVILANRVSRPWRVAVMA